MSARDPKEPVSRCKICLDDYTDVESYQEHIDSFTTLDEYAAHMDQRPSRGAEKEPAPSLEFEGAGVENEQQKRPSGTVL